MLIRNYIFRPQYRLGEKLLTRTLPPNTQYELHPDEEKHVYSAWMVIGSIVIAGIIMVVAGCHTAHAEMVQPAYTDTQIVNAIYRAENSKRYPYGVLATYKHTTPRQACMNTVSHARRDWNRTGRRLDFVNYLSLRYAPIGAANDPQGLNRNWVVNVRYYLGKG